jgi:hypothetical protein
MQYLALGLALVAMALAQTAAPPKAILMFL